MASTTTPTSTVTFGGLKNEPSAELIRYCSKNGFTLPCEANRFAHYIFVNRGSGVELNWFPISVHLDSNTFPHHLDLMNGDIVLILTNVKGLRTQWYIVTVKPDTDKLYWAVCDKKYLDSIDEDDPETVETIPAALLTFASNPFDTPQLESWREKPRDYNLGGAMDA